MSDKTAIIGGDGKSIVVRESDKTATVVKPKDQKVSVVGGGNTSTVIRDSGKSVAVVKPSQQPDQALVAQDSKIAISSSEDRLSNVIVDKRVVKNAVVGSQGPPGPRGEQGVQGEKGDPGIGASDKMVIPMRFVPFTLSISDIVRPDPSIDSGVAKCVDNTVWAIGVVIAIDDSTGDCSILVRGKTNDDYSGITKTGSLDGRVFLGTDGSPTQTLPSSGFKQMLGYCYEDGKINWNFGDYRVKSNPF